MARRVFRFKVDLRSKAPIPKEEPALDPRLSLEHAWEQELLQILPARLPEFDFPDLLSAQELLMSYNASLERVRAAPVGSQIENSIQMEVEFATPGCKSLLTCPLQHSSKRISQLYLSRDGNLSRISLESQGAGTVDLRYLMQRGLVDITDHELEGLPGYVWTATHFIREGGELVAVEQERRLYDPSQSRVRQWLQVLFETQEIPEH